MQYAVEAEVLKRTLDYLNRCPHGDVFEIIAAIRNSKQIKEEEPKIENPEGDE